MSSTIFRKIENTVVSASDLLSNLSGDQVKSIEFLAATKPALPLVLNDLGSTVNLNAEAYLQAAIGTLQVDKSDIAATGTYTLYVGTDSATQAAAYVRLFDLSTTAKRVDLNFMLANADNGKVLINLANTSGSHANINVYANGGSVNHTTALFGSTDSVGQVRTVEVFAEDLTSGSQIVGFNVLTVPYA